MSSSSTIEYFAQLHRDGLISIEQLRKVIDLLDTPEAPPKSPAPPTKTDEPPQSNVLENLRKRCRKKKAARKARKASAASAASEASKPSVKSKPRAGIGWQAPVQLFQSIWNWRIFLQRSLCVVQRQKNPCSSNKSKPT